VAQKTGILFEDEVEAFRCYSQICDRMKKSQLRKSSLFLKYVALFALSIASAQGQSAKHPQNRSYSIEHVSVISMNSADVHPDQTVVIANGRIAVVGPSSKVRVPANSFRINGTNKFLLPGLADMHVHLQSPVDLALFLVNGVTTVFDLNGKATYLEWRRQLQRREILGPQLFLCGPYFRDPEPVPEAVARVDAIAAAGYDAIKIKNNVTAEEFDAIVQEAKTHGLLILGHYPRKVDWQHVLSSGLNLAHEEEVLYGAFSPDGVYGDVDHGPEKVANVVQAIALSRTFLIPNLVMYSAISQQARDFSEFSARSEFTYLSPWQRDRFLSNNPYKNRPPNHQKEFETNLVFMKSVLTPALQKAGVKMLAGTDSEGLGTLAGFSLVDDLKLLHESGLTNFEALQTSTTYPALFVGREKEFGEIAPGFRADMMLVNDNPLSSLDSLRNVAGVFAAGEWLPEQRLTQLLNDVPNRYADLQATAERLLTDNNPRQLLRFLDFNDPYHGMGILLLDRLIKRRGFSSFTRVITNLRKYPNSAPLTSEATISTIGYGLLGQKQPDQAVQIFSWNAATFPQSANAYDSLADGYIAKHDTKAAIAAYERALVINPSYPNAPNARAYVKQYTIK
jgi:hypothetical protein